MIQDIKKEIRYGIRSYRFLILLVGFLFFAMLDPIMTKFVVPEIMKSQVPGITPEILAEMIGSTQIAVMRTYMSDIFEIGIIIVTFSLCGLLAQEINDNTLVLPICSGKRFGSIVFSKIAVFGSVLILIPVLSALVNYFYSGILFSYELIPGSVILAGFLQGIYMVFLVSLIVMWGIVLKKPISTGFVSLASVYGLHFIGGALKINEYLPSGLLTQAEKFSSTPASSLPQTVIITAAIIFIFATISVICLKNSELNVR